MRSESEGTSVVSVEVCALAAAVPVWWRGSAGGRAQLGRIFGQRGRGEKGH